MQACQETLPLNPPTTVIDTSPREVWFVRAGRAKLVVPGRTREEASANARARGFLDPDLMYRPGGNKVDHLAADRALLAEWGW